MYIRTRYRKNQSSKVKTVKESKSFSNKYLRTDKLNRAKVLTVYQLQVGWVSSGTPDKILFEDDMMPLENGWIELLMVMLHMLYLENSREFIFKLAEFGVGNSNVKIDRTYGTIDIDGVKDFTSYRLYDTPYHVEINFDPLSIMNSIAGLCRALGYSTKEVRIGLRTGVKEYVLH